MNNNRKFKRIIALILAVLNIFSLGAYAADEENTEYTYLDKMFGYAAEMFIDESVTKEDILDMAIKKYVQENPEALKGLLKAGFSELDDYSEYYSENEYLDFVNNINHTFYGIGVIIQKDGEYVKINQVLEDGSAYAAGIVAGDTIIAVDGENMKGKNIDYVQSAVVGELNTEVVITVLRDNEEYTYTLVRRPVNDTTVDYLVLDEETAYVVIINFAVKTAEEFKTVLDELDKKGITQIILDLRNNPGGYLLSAVDIAKMIVPEGIIVQTVYRQEENNITYYSDLKEAKYEFAVLVNENTASAAEILTSAIQDSGVGKVFGDTTYGKGIIQDVFNMRNGDSFKITTARYITRNGKEIHEVGISPDVYVVNGAEPIDVSKFRTIEYGEETSFGDVHENVSVIKERLMYLGYNVLNINTEFDSDLEAFVLDFQISKGLNPTGKLDRITMVQIENAFAQADVAIDSQLYKAYEFFGGTREKLDALLEN